MASPVTKRERSDNIETPMILLAGDCDPVIQPERLGGYEREALNMRLEVLEETGHWIPEEALEEMLEHMLRLYAS